MFEAEYNELNKYTLKASQSIANYYDKLPSLTDKDKQYIIEKILAELDIILIFAMNIRHQMLNALANTPATIRIQITQHLNELKTTSETAKTLSFNFTAIYHSTRDKLKGEIS